MMVRFLEDLVGADAGRLHRPIAFDVERRGVDIHPADFAFARLGRVGDVDDSRHLLGRVARVLAPDKNQPLVSLSLERDQFRPKLLVGQGLAHDVAVRALEPQYAQSLIHLSPTYSGANRTMRLP